MDREVFDLFVESHFTDRQVSLRTIMDKLEKMILKKALQEVDGNQKEASKLLGMNSTTLNAKLKKHSISPKKKN
jgi:DNA-binding protein Fis